MRIWGPLIGGWGLLQMRFRSRMLLITWVVGDAVLTHDLLGLPAPAYADPSMAWATKVDGWLRLPGTFLPQ
jgi:hypothetical protein